MKRLTASVWCVASVLQSAAALPARAEGVQERPTSASAAPNTPGMEARAPAAPTSAPAAPNTPAAQSGATAAPKQALSRLLGYVPLLEKARLFTPETGSVEELETLLAKASEDLVDGRRDQAAEALLSAVAEPRYAGLADFPAYHTAELLLATLLTEDHALESAQRIVDRMLARGSEHTQFASAFRRGVDIAMKRGDFSESAEHLAKFAASKGDTASELAYLRGLAAYESNDAPAAMRAFGMVEKENRFYANAQYMLGAIAAREKRFAEAEKRFCSIANQGKNDRFSFFVDGRFFPVRDLSMLGLGRVAHETARSDDAFYYYFQVPNDSPRVSEALFEAAWASYEGRDHDTAIDSLDQLNARFPRSPRAAEAAVLRGYVHLGRCEFGAAEKALLAFERNFAPVVTEADAVLRSPTARSALYEALLQKPERAVEEHASEQNAGTEQAGEEKAAPVTNDAAELLLSLMETDADFARLSSQLRSLDAELARSSRVPSTMRLLATKLSGNERPSAQTDEDAEAPAERLHERFEAGEAAVSALNAELVRLAKAGADKSELAKLRADKNRLDVRLRALSRNAATATADAEASVPEADSLPARLDQDALFVMAVRKRAFALRARIEAARDARGIVVLKAVRERLADELRRARIGRVDAVMGAKRKVELEVESLAAGRFPAELRDTLRMQSLLRDDEEYWPFEGDDWPDEFEERYAEEAE